MSPYPNPISTVSPMSSMDPSSRALFATTSRIISCLVTESLSRALYFPLTGFEATGFCVLLSGKASARPPSPLSDRYGPKDVLSIVLLQQVPVFKHDGKDPRAREVGLLDPMDMLPLTLELADDESGGHRNVEKGDEEHAELFAALLSKLDAPGWNLSTQSGAASYLRSAPDPLALWIKFARSFDVEENMIKEIGEEFTSAVVWQKDAYEHPPKAAWFESPSIDWEQSIVQAHPTHPMHKTRAFLPPMRQVTPGSYDLYHPKLRFASFPFSSLNIVSIAEMAQVSTDSSGFDKLIEPLRSAAAEAAGCEMVVKEGHVVIPVHELQVAHIEDKFGHEAFVYPEEFSLPMLAQQSIRSVIVPALYSPSASGPQLSLKLATGIKLTSAVRTISPASAFLGPRFSAQVLPRLTMPREIVNVTRELASVVHSTENGVDGEVAKHCAAIIREAYEVDSEARGERLIVCTALVEHGHSGLDSDTKPNLKDVPAVIRVFDLQTEAQRLEWLDKFTLLFFQAFLPSVMVNGMAFEAHPQNVLARFDLKTKELKGFIVRDFGGIKVHPETLYASTADADGEGGVSLDGVVVSGHSVLSSSLEDVYARMYHTVIHNHLQQLIRVMGLHYNGKGWEVVRINLAKVIPREHGLWEAWLNEEKKTFPGKCFLRMRMQGMYRFHLHGPFPNLIHCKGVTVEDSSVES